MDERKIYPISKVDPNDTKIELNCRTVKPILLYFKEKYGHKKLDEFIYATKMNLEYLENIDNWVSYDYFRRLLAKLVEYTGDPRAPFVAGTYSTKKECYGGLERFYSSLGSPSTTYKLVTEFDLRVTKVGKFTISDLKRNTCTIVLRFLDNYKQDKNNCLNIQGLLSSAPAVWNLPLAKVKELQCAAEGADSCVYEISWQNKPSHLYGLSGLLTGLVLVYAVNTFMPATIDALKLIIIPLVGYLAGRIKDYKVTLKDSMDFNRKESKDLMESVETIEKLNMELQAKVEERTEELKNALDELKKSQGQLIQSEKMASVGRLAAGMAHELNNPVGAVRNYIQDVLEDISQDSPLRERLMRVEKATDRCKRLVSDLLTFSRESKELKLVDINDVVENALSNAKEEISNAKISVSKELDPQLPKIKVDPLQIQQVFMNIIMNASDAVKGEGRISIKTYQTPDSIFVEISDTGTGIPEEIQDKIFDPFFTTKAPDKGKGLGLAISYNIIKRFDGDIKVKSEKGKGTTFILILPLNNAMAGAV